MSTRIPSGLNTSHGCGSRTSNFQGLTLTLTVYKWNQITALLGSIKTPGIPSGGEKDYSNATHRLSLSDRDHYTIRVAFRVFFVPPLLPQVCISALLEHKNYLGTHKISGHTATETENTTFSTYRDACLPF